MIIVFTLFSYWLPMWLQLIKRVQCILNLCYFMFSEPFIQQFFDLPLFLLHLCDVILYLCFFESLFEYVRPVSVLVILNPLILLLQVFNPHLFEYIVAEPLPRQGILFIFLKTALATSDFRETFIKITTKQFNYFHNYENQEDKAECSKFNDCMGALESFTRCKKWYCQRYQSIWQCCFLKNLVVTEYLSVWKHKETYQ